MSSHHETDIKKTVVSCDVKMQKVFLVCTYNYQSVTLVIVPIYNTA